MLSPIVILAPFLSSRRGGSGGGSDHRLHQINNRNCRGTYNSRERSSCSLVATVARRVISTAFKLANYASNFFPILAERDISKGISHRRGSSRSELISFCAPNFRPRVPWPVVSIISIIWTRIFNSFVDGSEWLEAVNRYFKKKFVDQFFLEWNRMKPFVGHDVGQDVFLL